MIVGKPVAIKMWIETDPVENAKHAAKMERFRKNSDWLQAHILEVYSQHRGKCICVAGQELFVGATATEAMEAARQAHPEEDAVLLRYLYRAKMDRVI